MNNTELKELVIEYGKKYKSSGLVVGTWGNISLRNEGKIFITPTAMDYDSLTPDDIVVCDINGNILEGKRKPSTEISAHLAIYNKRQDVNAIIHTHSIYATAMAAARKNIPAIVEDIAMIIGGEVPCAKYAHPGTPELGENIIEVLENKNAVLLANHGAIGMGRNLEEAYLVCQVLEKAARVYIFASQIGIPKPLAIEDVENMHNIYLNKYSRNNND